MTAIAVETQEYRTNGAVVADSVAARQRNRQMPFPREVAGHVLRGHPLRRHIELVGAQRQLRYAIQRGRIHRQDSQRHTQTGQKGVVIRKIFCSSVRSLFCA